MGWTEANKQTGRARILFDGHLLCKYTFVIRGERWGILEARLYKEEMLKVSDDNSLIAWRGAKASSHSLYVMDFSQNRFRTFSSRA
jgi:hypothetical protein